MYIYTGSNAFKLMLCYTDRHAEFERHKLGRSVCATKIIIASSQKTPDNTANIATTMIKTIILYGHVSGLMGCSDQES